MLSYFKKESLFSLLELIILFSITILLYFKFEITHNEMDIIPYAKSTYYNGLKPNWHINLQFPSSFLFNWLLGFFLEGSNPFKIIIIGRIISFLLISYSYRLLTKALKLNLFLSTVSFFFFLYFFGNGIGDAGEWIVGGLESKVIAYSFAIISLASFLKKRYKTSFLFSGLSLSVHLLVGAYNIFCLIPLLVIIAKSNRTQFFMLLKASIYFFITGIIGVSEILSSLTNNTSKEVLERGWDIYVNIRVPHHLIPDFSTKTWVLLILLTIVNLYFIKNKETIKKLLAYYALFSVLILLIGLIIFHFFDSHYLRFYFFRFSDVILPLISILLLLSTISTAKYIIALAISCFVIPKSVQKSNIKEIVNKTSYDINHIKEKTEKDKQMTRWILNNTNENNLFIIPPENLYFRLNTQRNIFISWWMLPNQQEYKSTNTIPQEMIEWYNRLKLLNLNTDFNNLRDVKNNYTKLDKHSILDIQSNYTNIKYILTPITMKLDFPIAKQTDYQLLYLIQ